MNCHQCGRESFVPPSRCMKPRQVSQLFRRRMPDGRFALLRPLWAGMKSLAVFTDFHGPAQSVGKSPKSVAVFGGVATFMGRQEIRHQPDCEHCRARAHVPARCHSSQSRCVARAVVCERIAESVPWGARLAVSPVVRAETSPLRCVLIRRAGSQAVCPMAPPPGRGAHESCPAAPSSWHDHRGTGDAEPAALGPAQASESGRADQPVTATPGA
jgi:hypothetical protein